MRVPGSVFAEVHARAARYRGHLLVSNEVQKPHHSAGETAGLGPRAPNGKSPAQSLRYSPALPNFRWRPRGRKWEGGLEAVLGSRGRCRARMPAPPPAPPGRGRAPCIPSAREPLSLRVPAPREDR